MRSCVILACVIAELVTSNSAASACAPPTTWSIAASFDLAANHLLPSQYPQIPATTGVTTIPPSVLSAVGWVESGWHQLSSRGTPLVSGDFGYGVMQITSGMAGAFHDVHGSIDDTTQSRIASDATYNIAQGAAMLAAKYAATPKIGNGDPQVIEHWYFALWAYNGWGWVNNPNNPRFSREGTPGSNPTAFPYQERVLYLVAHPPRDGSGNPLWRAIPVSLPAPQQVGRVPGPLPEVKQPHPQAPSSLGAVEESASLRPMSAGGSQTVSLRVVNTGLEAWAADPSSPVAVGYHLFTTAGDPWGAISPFAKGVVAYGQGIVPLPHNVLPGQSVRVNVTVRAPLQDGVFRVAWDLIQGATSWFSQQGSLPRAQVLHVLPAGQSPTVTPQATPTTTPWPVESLRYVADTSIHDGTAVNSLETFDKGWLVFNDGRKAWQPGWVLQLRSGASFGARKISVPGTGPCRSANVVAHMRAPAAVHSYRSIWQLRDTAGRYVGERLTLVVRVRAAGTGPTPTPTPRTTGTASVPTATATPVG